MDLELGDGFCRPLFLSARDGGNFSAKTCVMTAAPGSHDDEAVLCAYASCAHDRRNSDQIDAIFFDASNTKTFESPAARLAFRERWLGRYLDSWPEFATLACQGDHVAGYIVGCVIDPVTLPVFRDIPYFTSFASLTAEYPAHLHVNVHAGRRDAGLGGRLVEHFAVQAAAAGARGLHVVTSRSARNIGFYRRLGFHEAGTAAASGGNASDDVVFLARRL